MFRLLGSLSPYLKVPEIKTDSVLFRVHSVFTTVILLMGSLIITGTQYVGRPISCMSEGVPTKIINTFCWVTSTFTMPDAFRREKGASAHPGIANDFGDYQGRKYYTYYQWVCFFLFFQAMLCYFPQWIWKIWEGGLARTLAMGMNHSMQPAEEIKKKKSTLMRYLMTHIRMHNTYVYRYFVCEAFCLVNIFFQMYAMNRFLGGDFMTYGLDVLKISETTQDDRDDVMVYVFPRLTKCLFHKYGPSGSIQKHDALCLLPLNIVNEKTYIFLWFWFWILGVAFTALFFYRLALLSFPKLRAKVLHASARHLPIEVCRSISMKVSMGDWWILYLLSSNMDSLIYRDFLIELTKKIGDSHKHPIVS